MTGRTVGGAINVERHDVIEVDSIADPLEYEFARPQAEQARTVRLGPVTGAAPQAESLSRRTDG